MVAIIVVVVVAFDVVVAVPELNVGAIFNAHFPRLTYVYCVSAEIYLITLSTISQLPLADILVCYQSRWFNGCQSYSFSFSC